jgi:secondary thiamine-phosphate synthase enzyme
MIDNPHVDGIRAAGSIPDDCDALNPAGALMSWIQKQITLPPLRRGFHLITGRVLAALPELSSVSTGLLHVFIRHTSASLTINENADPSVLADMEASLNALAPESFPYEHTVEGPDDMPAHVKASLMGSSVSIPVQSGTLLLGTWQGIYLCEHRNRASGRTLVLTLQGE